MKCNSPCAFQTWHLVMLLGTLGMRGLHPSPSAVLPSEPCPETTLTLTEICGVKGKHVKCPTRGLTDTRLPPVLVISTSDISDLRGDRQGCPHCPFLDKKTELTGPAE